MRCPAKTYRHSAERVYQCCLVDLMEGVQDCSLACCSVPRVMGVVVGGGWAVSFCGSVLPSGGCSSNRTAQAWTATLGPRPKYALA